MKLDEIRKEIDEIDSELVHLFEKRMEIVKDVAKFKQKENMPILQFGREQAVLQKAREKTKDEQLKDKTAFFFQTLMDISKNSQYPYIATQPEFLKEIKRGRENKIPTNPKVICQGTAGSFSNLCAIALYPKTEPAFCNTFGEVFEAIQNGKADLGILPIENSSAGSVMEVYDLMKQFDFYIVGSQKVKVEHFLLAKQGSKVEDMKEVYSHWQALKQCGNFLKQHPKIEKREFENTALAAKFVAESERNDIACIASKMCGDLYGLDCLQENIEDFTENFTRFIVISKTPVFEKEHNHISLAVQLAHEPGSLYKLLTKFAIEQINLTKIESRPLPNTDFEFLFYLDIEANLLEEKTEKLLSAVANEVKDLHILGSYKQR